MAILDIFRSRESALARQVSSRNANLAFPEYMYEASDFIHAASGQDLLVSGGSAGERGSLLTEVLRAAPATLPKVVLSSGNPCLTAETLRRHGIDAHPWDWDPGDVAGVSYPQLLALLAARDRSLIPFWAFALDVLEACHRPLSVRTLHNVNWFAMDWQHELLAQADRETALELLTRYTPEFASQATRAVVVLEELCRSDSQPHAGVALDEALSHPWRVLCAAVPGRQSPLAQHCLDILTDAAQRGRSFLLVTDNVYREDAPILSGKLIGIPLVLAADDLCSLAEDITKLTDRRSTGVVLFRQEFAASARRLSEAFFGEYTKLTSQYTSGQSRHTTAIIGRQETFSLAISESKALRLDPLRIQKLAPGYAVVLFPDGREGFLQLSLSPQIR